MLRALPVCAALWLIVPFSSHAAVASGPQAQHVPGTAAAQRPVTIDPDLMTALKGITLASPIAPAGGQLRNTGAVCSNSCQPCVWPIPGYCPPGAGVCTPGNCP